MALSRYTSSSSLLAGNRFGNRDNENMVGKTALGKTRASSAMTTRSALGDIGNRVTALDSKTKGLKKDNLIAKQNIKATSKSTLSTVVEKENNTRIVKEAWVEVKEEPAISASPKKLTTEDPNAFSKQLLHVEDIDANDKENPQLVSEYVNEIYDYMRTVENAMKVNRNYLEGQEVNGRMRSILVDWLVQVHVRFHLLQETLYLTVDIIDRFLQLQPISRSKLQLVGVTSMLIASKYEEMYAPEVADFVYITDNAYTKADIRRMECLILRTLDFNLGKPLPLHFLRRNSKAGEVDANKHTLAKYLMELTIVDYDSVNYKPSERAAAALCLSKKLLDNSTWNGTLIHYSTYTEQDVLHVMQRMALLVTKSYNSKLTAIRTKYQSSKFMKISTLPELKSTIITELAVAAAE